MQPHQVGVKIRCRSAVASSAKSEQLGLYFKDDKGIQKPVILGSYGIGITRLVGTIVEIFSDDKGLVWPESVAPFRVHLVAIFGKEGASGGDGKVKKAADEMYTNLTAKGVEVLYDDRDASAGEKFGDSDLIGISWRYIISEKTLATESIEVKDRKTGMVEMKKIKEI